MITASVIGGTLMRKFIPDHGITFTGLSMSVFFDVQVVSAILILVPKYIGWNSLKITQME